MVSMSQALSVTATFNPAPVISPPPAPKPTSTVGSGRKTVARVYGLAVRDMLSCVGQRTQSCSFTETLQVVETFYGRRLVGVAARAKLRRIRRLVTIGVVHVKLLAGRRRLVRVGLNAAGVRLLRARKMLATQLMVKQGARMLRRQRVVFRMPKTKKR